MNESCHAQEWVVSRIRTSHVTWMKTHDSYDCFSERWMVWALQFARLYTYTGESCHTYEWVMSHIWMSHITYINESCHTYKWVTWHVWRLMTPIIVSWRDGCWWIFNSRGGAYIWVSYVTHMNASCHAYKLTRVTHTNESRHIYEDSWLLWLFLREMDGVGSSIREAVYVYKWVMSHIWMSHVTFLNTWKSHDTRDWDALFFK